MRRGVRELGGRRVLITGAASGIGRATAVRAAKEAAELVLTDIDASGLERAAEEAARAGGIVRVADAIDLADYEAVAAFAGRVRDQVGTMDAVMNIAGISTWGAVEKLEHRHWRETIDVDLMAPIHVIECFVPPMIEAGRGGHLVNVSSAAGLFGLPWHGPYSAAKFGLRGVSEVLRFDLRRHGIGVTLVCPGAVKTPLVDTVAIVGVNRDHPAMKRLTERFEAHASSPDDVAAQIIEAIKRGRYLVLTSRQVRIGYVAQRFFPLAYERAMRIANDQLVRAATRSQP
jgi:NAD(P)-dependent dehydrogenase (short-subunit alcohol dehydrogenase family)